MKNVFVVVVALLLSYSILAQSLPNYVNLGSGQTGLRNQGSRRTCITFASLAAMEAAYKRAGYGDIDLSEQFLNHLGKTFWLHHDWNEILAKGNDGSETQVGAFTGGNSVGYIDLLSRLMKVPEQAVMDYRDTDYDERDFAPLANPYNSDYWKKQRKMSDFNLDQRFLPQAALTANRYYSIRSFKKIDARNTTDIEKALAAGKEVSWDFLGADEKFPIWDTCNATPAVCGSVSHAMLIIGYDRRDKDPKKHYFIVKNSWGPSAHPDGYERLSYEYIRRYGTTAAYIESINPPMEWPELGFVGRWQVNFDGHKGTLDIYHIPHIHENILREKGVTTTDNRIGTFYDQSGKAFKVNGSMTGASIRFYIDSDNPNVKWDALRGREFSYTMLHNKAIIMSGIHKDPDGRLYGGYARKDNVMVQTSPLTGTVNPSSYIGKWSVQFHNIKGTLNVERSNTAITASFVNSNDFEGFNATLQAGTAQHSVQFFVEKKNPNHVRMQIPAVLGIPGPDGGAIRAYLLNFDKGTVAGTTLYNNGHQYGFMMMRNAATKVIVPAARTSGK